MSADTIRRGDTGRDSPERLAVFIDGFNVYWGLRDKGFKRFYWLHYQALACHFVRPGQVLVATKYFTTPCHQARREQTPPDDISKPLTLRGGIEIVEGRYRSRTVKCKAEGCENSWESPDEKMTDVAIATHMVSGALLDEYDTAVLVCADADLIPAVVAVRSSERPS